MRVALYLIGVAMLVIGLGVAYFTKDTLIPFEPFPVRLPIEVSPGFDAEQVFSVGHEGVYEVEFDVENPADLRPPQYSTWDSSIAAVDLEWHVAVGARKVASGRSSAYPDNSYGRFGGTERPRSGREIGQFNADKETTYTLRVHVFAGDPKLNPHSPRVNVKLDGQELSDLSNVDQFRELIHGVAPWFAAAGAVVVAVAVLLEITRKRRRAA